MKQEITRRLIELRTHLDSVEAEAIRHDFEHLNATLDELIGMHDELYGVYEGEKERYGAFEAVSSDAEDMMNAVEETLEAAQTTILLVIEEMREKYPDQPDRPEIIEFEEMVDQMRDEMYDAARADAAGSTRD